MTIELVKSADAAVCIILLTFFLLCLNAQPAAPSQEWCEQPYQPNAAVIYEYEEAYVIIDMVWPSEYFPHEKWHFWKRQFWIPKLISSRDPTWFYGTMLDPSMANTTMGEDILNWGNAYGVRALSGGSYSGIQSNNIILLTNGANQTFSWNYGCHWTTANLYWNNTGGSMNSYPGCSLNEYQYQNDYMATCSPFSRYTGDMFKSSVIGVPLNPTGNFADRYCNDVDIIYKYRHVSGRNSTNITQEAFTDVRYLRIPQNPAPGRNHFDYDDGTDRRLQWAVIDKVPEYCNVSALMERLENNTGAPYLVDIGGYPPPEFNSTFMSELPPEREKRERKHDIRFYPSGWKPVNKTSIKRLRNFTD